MHMTHGWIRSTICVHFWHCDVIYTVLPMEQWNQVATTQSTCEKKVYYFMLGYINSITEIRVVRKLHSTWDWQDESKSEFSIVTWRGHRLFQILSSHIQSRPSNLIYCCIYNPIDRSQGLEPEISLSYFLVDLRHVDSSGA